MKALSKFFLPATWLLVLAGCGGGGGSGAAFTQPTAPAAVTYSVTVTPGATSLAQNAITPVTVKVVKSDGTAIADGTSVSLSVTPAGLGTVGTSFATATSTTATGTTTGASTSFVFVSTNQGGAATLTASVTPSGATSPAVGTATVTVSSTASPLVTVTAASTSIGQNSVTSVTVKVKRADGSTPPDGTAVTLAVSPAGIGNVGSTLAAATSATATGSLAAGGATFVFVSGTQSGTAHITASVASISGTSTDSGSTDVTIGAAANPLVSVIPFASSIATNSFTSVVVTVRKPDGSAPADGSAVNASISPGTIGSISAVGSGQAAGPTASSTLSGGTATFIFNSGNQAGSATISVSVPSTGAAGSAIITIVSGNNSDPRLVLTATTTTLPLNPYGPYATTYPFPSNYLGSPYIAEVDVAWRHSNGALVSGTSKVNVSITPVSVASFSTLDDPTTTWSGQTKTPETVDGNEFLTLIGAGPVNVTGGFGTIFVHADDVPGTALLTVTAVDPDNSQTISSQITITIAGAASKLPASVVISAGSGNLYVSGSNGAQSSLINAQVADGSGAFVADPKDAQGNAWDNVQFQIVGPSGSDAKLSATNAAGQAVTGNSVNTVTHNGIANISLLAGSQQGPVQVRATVDRGDNNVDNNIQDAVSATTTVIISDGKLYSLALTQPDVNSILANAVSGSVTLTTQNSGTTATIPPNPNGTYSLTVSALGTDRQGNPVVSGTPIRFGSIDAPQLNNVLQIAGSQGNPVEGGTAFSAPDGHFASASGGAGPGDTLIVFGKSVPGNSDLESALKIQSVANDTNLTTVAPFNLNDTTGKTVDSGAVLPYVIGRSQLSNISATATTNSVGVASTTLNYPITALGKAVAIYAQGDGTDTNAMPARSNLVTDADQLIFPAIAPATIVVSPNPVPGNISTTVVACVYDALRTPIPNATLKFGFGSLGIGSASLNGIPNAGVVPIVTDSSGCVATTVTSTSITSAASATLTFSQGGVGGASTTVPIAAGGDLILLATPSALGGNGGNVALTLLNSNGTPAPGIQLTGSCTGDPSIGLSSGPGQTDANGNTSATIAASLNQVGSAGTGSCTFTTGTGTPKVVVNLGGVDLCKTGFASSYSGCTTTALKSAIVNLTINSTNSAAASASISSAPTGVACALAGATTQSCSQSPAAGTYTLTATAGTNSTIVGFGGDCAPSGATSATLTVPAPAATQVTLNCTLAVTGASTPTVTTVPANITIQSNNGLSVVASISSTPSGAACSIVGTTQTCTRQLTAGTTYTLAPFFTSGSFVGWSGDCVLSAGTSATLTVPTNATSVSCTLVLSGTASTGNLPVTINLVSLHTNNVNAYITSSPAGISSTNCSLSGTSSACNVLLPSGSTYTLTPTITTGVFFGWSGDCIPASGNTATLLVSPNRTSLACTLTLQ